MARVHPRSAIAPIVLVLSLQAARADALAAAELEAIAALQIADGARVSIVDAPVEERLEVEVEEAAGEVAAEGDEAEIGPAIPEAEVEDRFHTGAPAGQPALPRTRPPVDLPPPPLERAIATGEAAAPTGPALGLVPRFGALRFEILQPPVDHRPRLPQVAPAVATAAAWLRALRSTPPSESSADHR